MCSTASIPRSSAARVLEAVTNGELYIFTHPAMRAFVEARFQMILGAFDAAANSPALASVKDHSAHHSSHAQAIRDTS